MKLKLHCKSVSPRILTGVHTAQQVQILGVVELIHCALFLEHKCHVYKAFNKMLCHHLALSKL